METEICDCKHEYCDGYKYWATNPFAEEIRDDHSLHFECDGDRYEAGQDI